MQWDLHVCVCVCVCVCRVCVPLFACVPFFSSKITIYWA